MGTLLEDITTSDWAEKGVTAGTFLRLVGGSRILVEPSETTLRGLLDLSKPVTVHYHPRLTMHEGDWPKIQSLLMTLEFDSERIEHQRTLTYQELADLPHRVYGGGVSRNVLYLSHPMDFQGPWYTHKPVHYALLDDGGRLFKVWLNTHLGVVEKVEGGIVPKHFI